MGLTGDVGATGPIGLTGPAGRMGERGPVGPVGMAGEPGQTGQKGDRGEPVQIRKSAFSVQKTSNQEAAADAEIVTLDAARVNIGGHFDLTTNRFTCEIPGVYFFSYSFYVTESPSDRNPDIDLVNDNNVVARARVESVANVQIGTSVLLELETGSEVWLQFLNYGEGMECADKGKCQFSGFLLYEG
ncbi:complement C1q tumor necrosis factor-related protein 4-like [Amphiura filiformis]|uniref:complement C1q tumor necrosis factor-related protein 4-like n=1 Tax=Amphiura filiformis TaxID=82378 RepID=UPI003B2264A5